MLNPGVLVLIVLDAFGPPLATANEVVSTLVGPVGVVSAALRSVERVDVLNGAGGVKSDGSGLVLSLVLVSAGVVPKEKIELVNKRTHGLSLTSH